ncbi:MAG: efflux RND transporter periplasmic adaptor subunit [Ignavibacteriales bacterium]
MSRRRTIVVAVVTVCAILVTGVLWFNSRNNSKTRAQSSTYATAVARRAPLVVTVGGTGSVTLADRREIRAEVRGIVKEILVDEGQSVKNGDVIMRLQNDELIAQARQARISYDLALNKLADMVGTSPDKAMSVDVSKGLTVTSKSSGRLTSLKVAQGDQVSSGSVIGSVAQDANMYFVTALTEGYALQLKAGDAVSIRIDGFDGEIEGRVSSISTSARASGSSVWRDVSVEIPNPGLLRAGSTGIATFHTSDGKAFLGDGKVELPSSESIKSPVSGTVSKILLREGATVRVGDPILVITDPSLSTSVKSSRLSVEQSLLDLERKQDDVDALTIRAPADGVVVSIPVDLGNNIEESPVLAVIADTQHAQAVIEVDELDVGKLKIGMPAKVTVDALGGKVFNGSVRTIAAEGAQQSGVAKFDVTVDIDTPDELRTGMTASVEITVASKQDTLVVPAEAVTGTRGQEVVNVIDADGKVSTRPVKVGLSSSRFTEITDGLQEGERIAITTSPGGTDSRSGQMRMFMGPGGPPPSQTRTSTQSGGQQR